MNEKHDSAADVRLERIVSLRPCPFCGGDAELLFFGSKPDAVACKECGAQSDIEPWNRRAADKYERANPLGGPAKIFEAVASRVRAGEPLDDVMLDYGLRWTDKAG